MPRKGVYVPLNQRGTRTGEHMQLHLRLLVLRQVVAIITLRLAACLLGSVPHAAGTGLCL